MDHAGKSHAISATEFESSMELNVLALDSGPNSCNFRQWDQVLLLSAL